MNNPKQFFEEECGRGRERARLLMMVRERLDRGDTVYAIGTLALIVEMLSASEDRVIRLHAECLAMVEHAGKILALDAARRPIIISGTGDGSVVAGNSGGAVGLGLPKEE